MLVYPQPVFAFGSGWIGCVAVEFVMAGDEHALVVAQQGKVDLAVAVQLVVDCDGKCLTQCDKTDNQASKLGQ